MNYTEMQRWNLQRKAYPSSLEITDLASQVMGVFAKTDSNLGFFISLFLSSHVI